MNRFYQLIYFFALILASATLSGLQVYTIDGKEYTYNIMQLQALPQESFDTHRFKHEQNLDEQWQGISLQNWLHVNGYTDFQSIRLESNDNYMVQLHRAELDTMPGYIALAKDGALLDSTEIRVIFPGKRDMFWIRGLNRIYLEDFQPTPPPQQIFSWDTEAGNLPFSHDLKPFADISGYFFEDVMKRVFYSDSGSIIIVCRDGLRSRLEYPKHLRGAILEKTSDGTINLKSPVIPAGMWLKDVVYLQCGPYATIRFDYLQRLPGLNKILDWHLDKPIENVIKAHVSKSKVKLESFFAPAAAPLQAGEWIELP